MVESMLTSDKISACSLNNKGFLSFQFLGGTYGRREAGECASTARRAFQTRLRSSTLCCRKRKGFWSDSRGSLDFSE